MPKWFEGLFSIEKDKEKLITKKQTWDDFFNNSAKEKSETIKKFEILKPFFNLHDELERKILFTTTTQKNHNSYCISLSPTSPSSLFSLETLKPSQLSECFNGVLNQKGLDLKLEERLFVNFKRQEKAWEITFTQKNIPEELINQIYESSITKLEKQTRNKSLGLAPERLEDLSVREKRALTRTS